MCVSQVVRGSRSQFSAGSLTSKFRQVAVSTAAAPATKGRGAMTIQSGCPKIVLKLCLKTSRKTRTAGRYPTGAS